MLKSTNATNMRLAALRRGYVLSKARPHTNRYSNIPCGYRISKVGSGDTVLGLNFELSEQEVLDFLNENNCND